MPEVVSTKCKHGKQYGVARTKHGVWNVRGRMVFGSIVSSDSCSIAARNSWNIISPALTGMWARGPYPNDLWCGFPGPDPTRLPKPSPEPRSRLVWQKMYREDTETEICTFGAWLSGISKSVWCWCFRFYQCILFAPLERCTIVFKRVHGIALASGHTRLHAVLVEQWMHTTWLALESHRRGGRGHRDGRPGLWGNKTRHEWEGRLGKKNRVWAWTVIASQVNSHIQLYLRRYMYSTGGCTERPTAMFLDAYSWNLSFPALILLYNARV